MLLVLAACGGVPEPGDGGGPGPSVQGIHGAVVDQNGNPVPDAIVEVLPAGSEPHPAAGLETQNHRKLIDETDAEGEFAIEIEQEGDYTVIVTKGNLGAAETEIRIEQDEEGNIEEVEVTLTVRPLGHIEGDVILQGLPDDLGADIFIPGTTLAARSETDGEWVIDNVPAGGWELVIHYPGFSRFETFVEVEAGEVTFVEDVTLQPVAPLVIAPFTASPNTGNVPHQTTFSWQVDNPEGGALTCSLDVNSDAIPDYELENCSEGSQTHTYQEPGTYLATLLVRSPLQQAQATTVVVVGEQGAPPPPPPENHAPTAVAGEDDEVDAGTPALLDGSFSHDPDGDRLRFSWTLEAPDGTNATGLIISPEAVRTSFTPVAAGTYTATLTVTDGELSDSDSTVITAVEPAPNQAPVASFTAMPTSGPAPLEVAFDASASSDPDGSIASYSWDFGDGTTGSGATTSHSYAEPGTYTVTLMVTDNQGAEATDSLDIVVGAPAPGPTVEASFTASPTAGDAPLGVTVDARGSTIPEGATATYSWDFGDPDSGSNTASGPTATHTYNEPGTYTITLTVTTDAGGSDTHTIDITVLEPAPSQMP